MKLVKWIVGVGIVVVVLAVGGTWAYINLIKEDAPSRLTLADSPSSASPNTTARSSGSTTGGSSGSSGTGGSTGATSASGGGSGAAELDGTWKVTSASQAGYRVKEVLFGQDTEGVGRTNEVEGQLVISGTSIPSASFTIDMASVTSDSSQRDGQYKTRIMAVDDHPTSTFTLTEPIDLGTLPADGQTVTVQATGDLTLRGTTKSVTVDLEARRSGQTIEVAGTIPIVFADYGIPNPSFGPASTEDHGEIEFKLVLEHA